MNTLHQVVRLIALIAVVPSLPVYGGQPSSPQHANRASTQGQSSQEAKSEEKILSDLRGRVVDAKGKPLSQVGIVVVHSRGRGLSPKPGMGNTYTTSTDRDGKFQLNQIIVSDEAYRVSVCATADNYLLTSTSISKRQGGELEPIQLQLAPADTYKIKFQDEHGKPLQDTIVRPTIRYDSNKEKRHYIPSSYAPEAFLKKTNSQGEVTLSVCKKSDSLTLSCRLPNGTSVPKVRLKFGDQRDLVVPLNSKGEPVATVPIGVISGRVVDENDRPIANARLHIKVFTNPLDTERLGLFP